MVQVDNWDTFTEKSVDLYVKDPIKCRLTTKYRPKEGTLCIKTTDDKEVYTYSANQRDIKNIAKFLSSFMNKFTQ